MTPAGLTKRSIGSALPNTWQHGSINRGYEAFRLYANGDTVANLEARGIEVLVAVPRPENARTYDFRPPNRMPSRRHR